MRLDGIRDIVDNLGPWPVALTGCRANDTAYALCGYDIVLFDENTATAPTMVKSSDNQAVIIYHGSTSESRPQVLAGYHNMRIIRDDTMVLAPLVNSVKSHISKIFVDCARDSLTDAIMCSAKSLDGKTQDMAACWQKCAGIRLCDAVLAMNHFIPSSHSLHHLRHLNYNADTIKGISDMLGVERASTILIDRMTKAVTGIYGGYETMPDIIRQKAGAMLQERRLADCYYYLCRQAGIALYRDYARPEFAYRIAMDVERNTPHTKEDATLVSRHAERLLKTLNARYDASLL